MVAAEAKRGKIDSGMPNGEAPKPHLGVHACPVFLEKGDEWVVLGLTHRLSNTTRLPHNHLLERRDWKKLKWEDGPLCALFGHDARYASGAIVRHPSLVGPESRSLRK